MTVLKRHPVDRPSISQRFAASSDRGIHLGIDYRPDYPGQTDFPVYAAHDGFVVFARGTAHVAGNPWEQIPGNGNNGNSVILQAVAPHQACATSYNHLGTIAVKEGQWVTAGTFLGYMGWTGFVIGQWGWNGWQTDRNPSGTHLHFELFIDYGNGQYPPGTSYGRVNPLEYFAIETTIPVAPGASGGGSTSKEPELSRAEVDEIKSHISALLTREWHNGDQVMKPGGNLVVIQNQKEIRATPQRVAQDVKVRRGGKEISWVQDTADTNTMVRELRGTVAALTELVGQLANGQDIDYERIKEGTREVLAQETVTVTVDVTPKEQP